MNQSGTDTIPASPCAALLRVENLSKRFGGLQAVDDVSFELAAGRMLALIGPNGAGKSTTFNLLNGQISPDQGHVRLAGVELTGLSPREIGRQGVGRTFQTAAVFGSFSVLENIQIALMARDRRLFSFWRKAHGYRTEEAMDLLTQVGMQDCAGRLCGVLAYGDIKRVELAIALAGRPRLLLMDEPAAGMTAPERHALMALVRRLADERDMAILFTEHSLDVVFAHANQIVVLAQGRIIAAGTPDEIRIHAGVRSAYLGSTRI